jgi:rhamnosyltransferase subunit B
MNVLLMTFGTVGDVNPFIGLGIALKARGHTVSLAANPYFEESITGAGLQFIPIGDREEYLTLLNHPDLWDSSRGVARLTRDGIRILIRPGFELVRHFAQTPESVIVAPCTVLSARLAQEKWGIPVITVNLSPAVIYSLDASPANPGVEISQWPRWIRRGLYQLNDLLYRRLFEPDFSQLRRELGLSPVRGLMFSWFQSPLRSIGLWPEWFGPIQRDWPPNTTLTNFPLYDEAGVKTLPADLEAFLNEGTPPVVFTPGSAMRQSQQFFQESVNACRQTGYRGLIMTKFADQVPSHMPSTMRALGYVPFSRLLPRCAALVHQGGIGNTSQAFSAGIPQIVIPLTFDQPDTAARVQRLGAGLTLRPKDYRSDKVAELLHKIHTDPSYRLQARELQKKVQGTSGLTRACEVIEQTCQNGPFGTP